MKRLDDRTEPEIVEALTYATTDQFWKANIRSAKKFREKFETLLIQSRGRNQRQNNQQNSVGAGAYYKERIAEMEAESRAREEPIWDPEIQ